MKVLKSDPNPIMDKNPKERVLQSATWLADYWF